MNVLFLKSRRNRLNESEIPDDLATARRVDFEIDDFEMDDDFDISNLFVALSFVDDEEYTVYECELQVADLNRFGSDVRDRLITAIEDAVEKGEFEGSVALSDPYFETVDVTDVNAVNALAKRMFGLTSSYVFAGYMLVDGSLLNFSGGRAAYTRGMDHRSISGIEGMDMYKFIALGNIRMAPESKGIHIMKEPTEAQYSKLADYIRWCLSKDDFTIDVTNENGDNIAECVYERYEWTPFEVIEDIKSYFNGGDSNIGGSDDDDYEDDMFTRFR